MAQADEFLTFRLGAESHGIEILKVQEIRACERPTTRAAWVVPIDQKSATQFASSVVNTSCITGLATADDRLVIPLDIERLMSAADMALFDPSLH